MKLPRTKKHKIILFTILSIILVVSLSGTVLILDQSSKNEFEWQYVSNNLGFSASSSITIDNRTYYLKALLIEDHMPGADMYKGVISIVPTDDLNFPDDLLAYRVWITERSGLHRTITKRLSGEYFYYNELLNQLTDLPFWVFCGRDNIYVQLIHQRFNIYYLVASEVVVRIVS